MAIQKYRPIGSGSKYGDSCILGAGMAAFLKGHDRGGNSKSFKGSKYNLFSLKIRELTDLLSVPFQR
jgi:hypothetical protein